MKRGKGSCRHGAPWKELKEIADIELSPIKRTWEKVSWLLSVERRESMGQKRATSNRFILHGCAKLFIYIKMNKERKKR